MILGSKSSTAAKVGGKGLLMAGTDVTTSTIGSSRLKRFLVGVDWPLIAVVALISGIGLLNLYSAVYRTPHLSKFNQQLYWSIVGWVMFMAITALDYRNLLRLAWIVLAFSVVAMLAVVIVGKTSKGAQRWLNFGFARVQPTEFVKIAVILAMAKLLHDRDVSPIPIKATLLRIAAIAFPIMLIAAQPDLGSSILTLLIVLSISFLAAPRLWPPVVVILVGLAMLPIVWDNMQPYQRARVEAFADQSVDKSGANWHTRQSIFAVGSGQITGKGYTEGTQNQFSFLPEQWTDFPFSVWAEEWGFLGSVFLLFLFLFLIVWCINAALGARDKFGSVICIGVAAMTFWHVVVNVCMVLGMAPVVGVTLPLISYGGSSLVTFFIALGLVSSVSRRPHS